MSETHLTCEYCNEEIVFDIEYVEADDFQNYQATYREPQPDCTCELLNSEMEELETEATKNYNEDLGNDY
jgi:hypothetical protein